MMPTKMSCLPLGVSAVVAGLGMSVASTTACSHRGEETFQLSIAFSQSAQYACASPSCGDILVECDSVVSLRVTDAISGQPYASLCEPLPPGTLCGLGDLALPAVSVPTKPMNVAVLVWSRAALPADGSCPTNTMFDPYGFPLAVAPTPALGGQSFFTPGDTRTVEVTLGCVDVNALGAEACEDPDNVRVNATLLDIASRVPVGSDIAERVSLGFGEPVLQLDDEFQPVHRLLTPQLTPLLRQATSGVSEWLGLAPRPNTTGCIHMLDDVAEAVGTVTCVAYEDTARLTPRAYFVDEARRNRVLAALSLSQFPNEGLVYGLILDVNGEPLANAQAIPSAGSVSYLEIGQTALLPGGTSAGGDFASTTVPFTASWTVKVAQEAFPRQVQAVGGLISEKLTVVILRLTEPVSTD